AVPCLRDQSAAHPLCRQRDELLSALPDERTLAGRPLAVALAQEGLAEIDRRARAIAVMSEDWARIIVHADMDAFYAAVEQLDDPSLRGRPLLVGSDSARGVVLTASYEARPSGAGSAMPMQRARRLCPEALVVPPRFERYQEVSELVMKTFGDPESIGKRIKAAVRECTGGLTASVGISGTRYVAKVASGFRKPDGLTIVPPAMMRDWLAALPVSSLWGAGPKTTERLKAKGWETIGQIANADAAVLERSL